MTVARRSAPSQPKSAALTPEKMRAAIPRLEKRIADLEALDPQTVQKRWAPEVAVLQTAIEETLADVFGQDSSEYARYTDAATLDHGAIIVGRPASLPEARQYLTEGKQRSIALLRQAIRGLEERLESQAQVSGYAAPATLSNLAARKVFVVHGHDEGARESVARFLDKLDLESIILHERPNKGRTLITKFREESADIGFAVVLMTPDDQGGKAGQADTQPRARQNVVFELGFFIGALGPERVAALVKGDIERPSDFDGVVYIDLDDAGGWKQQLGRELQAAGFEIDWKKVMRS
jgi:predicted nucleotide-binding protein